MEEFVLEKESEGEKLFRLSRGDERTKKKPNKYRSYFETKLAKKIVQLEAIYDGQGAIQIFSHGGREVYREKLINQCGFESI